MSLGFEIEAPDIKEQVGKFVNADKIVNRHSIPAMQKSVKTVVASVRPLTPVGVSARLRRSIVSKVTSTRIETRGTVFSNLQSEVYPSVMNFGRRAGARMPPPSALERWVRLKLRVPADRVKSVAFVVARAIGRKGIKGKFFMQKGFAKAKPVVDRFWKVANDRITKDLSID